MIAHPMIHITVLGMVNSGKTEILDIIKNLSLANGGIPTKLKFVWNGHWFTSEQLVIPDEDISLVFYEPTMGSEGFNSGSYTSSMAHKVGILCVVDSTDDKLDFPEHYPSSKADRRFHSAISLYQLVREEKCAHIVVANKQDLPSAYSAEKIAKILRVKPDIPVLPVSAKTDPASIRNAIYALLERLPQDEVTKTVLAKFPH